MADVYVTAHQIENGFYYDMYLEEGGVSSNDFSSLETLCKKIIKEKQTFERLEVKRKHY